MLGQSLRRTFEIIRVRLNIVNLRNGYTAIMNFKTICQITCQTSGQPPRHLKIPQRLASRSNKELHKTFHFNFPLSENRINEECWRHSFTPFTLTCFCYYNFIVSHRKQITSFHYNNSTLRTCLHRNSLSLIIGNFNTIESANNC